MYHNASVFWLTLGIVHVESSHGSHQMNVIIQDHLDE